MPEYHIVLARSAEREIENLPEHVQDRIMRAIDNLAANPRPPGVKKLRGASNLWRVRVGEYRIIYQVFDKEHLVDIARVRHRREAYA